LVPSAKLPLFDNFAGDDDELVEEDEEDEEEKVEKEEKEEDEMEELESDDDGLPMGEEGVGVEREEVEEEERGTLTLRINGVIDLGLVSEPGVCPVSLLVPSSSGGPFI